MVRRAVEAGGRRRKSRDALTSRPEIERLLVAARAPASPRELAGERAAVDLFARARLVSSATGQDVLVPSRPVRTGLKAAIAAAGAVGLLTSGVAFATTGHVPFASTLKQVTQQVTGQGDDGADKTGNGPKGDSTASPNGPKAAALQGLCRAYAKGQKAAHGNAWDQRPFQTLLTAAGGADQVADFCASLPPKAHQAGPGPTHPTPSHPTTGPGGGPTDHPTHPTHPTSPTHPASPTHPTRKPHPTHPTQSLHPTRPTDTPSRTAKPQPSHRAP